jgi:hypothetical protein
LRRSSFGRREPPFTAASGFEYYLNQTQYSPIRHLLGDQSALQVSVS